MSSGLAWAVAIACLALVAWGLRRAQRRMEDRRREEEARAAAFLAQVRGAPAAAAAPAAPEERLLFDAAGKAAEAGEAALSIQLYARLIARFPQSVLVAQARAAVEVQKKRLSTARAPGTSAPD